jgi:DNA-binding transcriptional LysR family regulator
MELHQVRYFLAVADALNFTRAAEHCHVSQPALTRAIQQLEEELGALLLRRERKLTYLTDFGRHIEPNLRQLFADAEAAKTLAKRFINLREAQVRLGVICTIAPARFRKFLISFRTANPGCEIILTEGTATRLSEMLIQADLDLALMMRPEPFNERLDVLPLYRERFCVAFPTGHRLEGARLISISEIAGETYLRRINGAHQDDLMNRLREHGLATFIDVQSDREDWIQMMIAAGFGVCLLPESSPTIPGVSTRLVAEPEIVREVSLVSMSGRCFSRAVGAFVRAIRAFEWSQTVAKDRL